ncbi:MAG TPA: hypothetical protein PLR18_00400 [bacterium]|nr:hypothetical protein [bacterium]
MNFNNRQLNMESWKPVYTIGYDCGAGRYFVFDQGDYYLKLG